MLGGEGGIEARGRLVGQDHAGRLRERARDGHALLLAARQRVGAALGEVGEADLVQARAAPGRGRRSGKRPSRLGSGGT